MRQPPAEKVPTDSQFNVGGTSAPRATNEVGYKHPPAEHKFAPGVSGNPKGRPRKRDWTGSELISRLMRKKVSLKTGNFLPIEIAFKATLSEAAKGNMKAVKQLVDFQKDADEFKVGSAPLFSDELAKSIVDAHDQNAGDKLK